MAQKEKIERLESTVNTLIVELGLTNARLFAVEDALYTSSMNYLDKEEYKRFRMIYLKDIKDQQIKFLRSLEGEIPKSDLIQREFDLESSFSYMKKELESM